MPNNIISVCMCARFQAPPNKCHFKTVKVIFRYLTETLQHDIWFPKVIYCNLVGFLDFDFGGCKSDIKSTSGTCHFIGNRLVS